MEESNMLSPRNSGFAGERKDTLVKRTIGIGVSVAVLFATVWVVGKAWKSAQK